MHSSKRPFRTFDRFNIPRQKMISFLTGSVQYLLSIIDLNKITGLTSQKSMNLTAFYNKLYKVLTFSILVTFLFTNCNEDDSIPASALTCSSCPLVTTADNKNSSENEVTLNAPVKLCSSCTHVIAANTTTIDGHTLGFKPGDVICLDAKMKYNALIFKNIIGTRANPIIITNCNGTVNIIVTKPWNLKTANSKHFRLTGGDTNECYGIRLSGSTANGVILTDFSTNFEVDHIEVFNVGFAGIMAKTDPTCDDATTRGHFTMYDVSLHDNYIHDTAGEGFYIGHSFYGGYNVTGCGTRLPHTIEGIDIYNNRVVKTGWDGIQLGCATKRAAVFDNTVENYGTKNTIEQQNGIIIGSGTGGFCYGNFVNGGTGGGITVFGLGDNIIHDNIVLNAGEKGMFCDERNSTGPGFKFINNTIINPKTEGIAIYSETLPKNVCINNIIVNPGTFNIYGESSYIRINKNAPTEKSNNLTTRDITSVKFQNAAGKNFRLQSTSPAIGAGKNIAPYSIMLDFYKANRLKGMAYDIGASEF